MQLGAAAGLLGAGFIALQHKITLFRLKYVPVSSPHLRVVEVAVIIVFKIVIEFVLAVAVNECRPRPIESQFSQYLQSFYCESTSYNELASFFMVPSEVRTQLIHCCRVKLAVGITQPQHARCSCRTRFGSCSTRPTTSRCCRCLSSSACTCCSSALRTALLVSSRLASAAAGSLRTCTAAAFSPSRDADHLPDPSSLQCPAASSSRLCSPDLPLAVSLASF